MEVICVGLPRSGTESLQQALLMLGYDYTYHGWDIVFENPVYSPGWVALARRKWYSRCSNGDGAGDDEKPSIMAADFDALLGHAVAVTDAAASCFATEMIAAYPDAKVVLNVRRDSAAWHRSVQKTLVRANRSWAFYLGSFFNRECFWAWHVYERFLWPLLFRAPDGRMAEAIRRNGKLVYREHCNMIRGMVPKDRLLEWDISDGWEPLCKFLGKPVPNEEFPHANAVEGGWKAREEQCNRRWLQQAFANIILCVVMILGFLLYRAL
ncbi:hypothetical protein SPI_02111 [Niveomyces insectorum RCEF 264]|uniref:NAD dependent epimerase/dehydratase n=1 Tax=Niveomyces insectorum RCEF 264 TaxID=1081102 RepID=A0A167XS87_9HYPO|nr:hypothetical protein SPI_02111 [Niveomyces insectorum RCEF 264]